MMKFDTKVYSVEVIDKWTEKVESERTKIVLKNDDGVNILLSGEKDLADSFRHTEEWLVTFEKANKVLDVK